MTLLYIGERAKSIFAENFLISQIRVIILNILYFHI